MTISSFRDEELGNPKLLALGADAFLLRFNAILYANKELNNGLVEADMVAPLAMFSFHRSKRATQAAVALLVARGEWHASGDACDSDKCPVKTLGVPDGCYRMHDFWNGYGERADAVKDRRRKSARKTELLGDEFLQRQIILRDGMQCRYCTRKLRKTGVKDTRSKDKLTFDHIDPDGPNVLENIVVACQDCNNSYREVPVDDKLRDLRPAPNVERLRRLEDQNATTHGPDQNQTSNQNATRENQTKTSDSLAGERVTRDSEGTRDRSWSGSGPGGGPGVVAGLVGAGHAREATASNPGLRAVGDEQ